MRQSAYKIRELALADIAAPDFRAQMPEILAILLRCRTRSTEDTPHNIIWANDNYTHIDPTAYGPTAPITPDLITGAQAP